MKRSFIALLLLSAGALFLNGCSENQTKTAPRELNIVGWIGYDEEDFIKPFEEEFNVKVNFKTAVGDNNIIALMEQSPDLYDLIVITIDSIPKLAAKELLQPLNRSDFPVEDFFPPFNDLPIAKVGEKTFAIPIRWGGKRPCLQHKISDKRRCQLIRHSMGQKSEGESRHMGILHPKHGSFKPLHGQRKSPRHIRSKT